MSRQRARLVMCAGALLCFGLLENIVVASCGDYLTGSSHVNGAADSSRSMQHHNDGTSDLPSRCSGPTCRRNDQQRSVPEPGIVVSHPIDAIIVTPIFLSRNRLRLWSGMACEESIVEGYLNRVFRPPIARLSVVV